MATPQILFLDERAQITGWKRKIYMIG